MRHSHILAFTLVTTAVLTTGGMQERVTYSVPAKTVEKVFRTVTMDELLTIKAEEELNDSGTITALVIRPETNKRRLVQSLALTRRCCEGDKFKGETYTDKELDSVTLMRADVSQAIGGAHIAGDNIHVAGLRIGTRTILPGDLLRITDSTLSILKAILLVTHIPHYACWKFQARCGKLAFDFVNAEGEFEQGVTKKTAHGRGDIHGLRDRLRGLRLFVLKEGTVNVGDRVTLVPKALNADLLWQIQGNRDAGLWLEKSRTPAEATNKEEKAKREIRSRAIQPNNPPFSTLSDIIIFLLSQLL